MTPTLASVLRKQLTPDRCEQLDLDGFVVIPNALPEEMARQFLDEVRTCFETIDGARIPNEVEFLTSNGPVKLTKPHIFECDLHQQSVRKQLPLFDDLFEHQLGDLVDVLQDKLASCEDLMAFCGASAASQAVTLKLQMNEGGAFPWHYDNPSRPNRRRLTMAVYLTPDWLPEMGGELQVLPFLGPVETIPPIFNTIVLFSSDRMLHRVLPICADAHRTRYCFTVWFDGQHTNTEEDQYLRVQHLQESAIPFLKRSAVQRTLARAVYQREFEAALRDCFGPSSLSYKISMQEHDVRLKELMANDKVRDFVALLQEYREDLCNNNNND